MVLQTFESFHRTQKGKDKNDIIETFLENHTEISPFLSFSQFTTLRETCHYSSCRNVKRGIYSSSCGICSKTAAKFINLSKAKHIIISINIIFIGKKNFCMQESSHFVNLDPLESWPIKLILTIDRRWRRFCLHTHIIMAWPTGILHWTLSDHDY